jgi:valyl-tRNA synthetase
MSLASVYKPKEYEHVFYEEWQKAHVGMPSDDCDTAHTILMPPPNLTGDLHAGHAFQHFLMDTLTRIARQDGKSALWYPGVDHAGIQLEGVIDKLIKKGEFDAEIAESGIDKNLVPKEDLPKYIKTQNPDLWLRLAWSKVNLWRDNQQQQSSILGDTPDYDRSLFTLDIRAVQMVNSAFVKYWQDGLIYKGSYLVNWSVGLQTAVSDVAGEIEYEKRVDPFVTFEYGVLGVEYSTPELAAKYSNISLKKYDLWKRPQLSTVRPETKFTDIAIAMHPSKFEVYFNSDIFETEHLLNIDFINDIKENKIHIYYHLPSLHNGRLKLVVSEKVDAEFGTGVMKITPAHDPFDYELCKEFVESGWLPHFRADACIGRDGKLTAEFCGEFGGMKVEDARPAIFKRLIETGYIPIKTNELVMVEEFAQVSDAEFWSWKLDDKNQYIKDHYPNHQIDWNYEHNVAVCERSKTVIEPLISEEFFIDYHKPVVLKNGNIQTLAEIGLGAITTTEFYPETYRERGDNFIKNIKNWCISRDLLWGHKMPVWYNIDTNPEKVFYSNQDADDQIDVASKFQISSTTPNLPGNWVQEEKILDTWFSSCLWPLSTLGFGNTSTIVLIHGSPATHREKMGERHWFPWLRDNLIANGHSVIIPEMPDAHLPNYQAWKREFEFNVPVLDESTILVGHSAGGAFLVRYLGEKLIRIKQLVLLSASWEQTSDNSRLGDLLDFSISQQIQELGIDVVVATSTNEPEYRHRNARKYTDELSGRLITFSNYGHFIESDMGKLDFPELLDLLLIKRDFDRFYQTQEMITGKDIFYQWIIRMTMVCTYFTGQIPYKKVIITPTVQDERGRKMSKSLGNGLDAVATINKYSSDSLRMAMLGAMIPDRNIKMGGNIADELCEKYRNFGNKLWNVARFLEMKESISQEILD